MNYYFLLLTMLSVIPSLTSAMVPHIIAMPTEIRTQQYHPQNIDDLCFDFFGTPIDLTDYGITGEAIMQNLRERTIQKIVETHCKHLKTLKRRPTKHKFLNKQMRQFDQTPPTCSLDVAF